MHKPIAVLDACVLYPAPLRDFLMQLILEGAFRGHWSNQIHDEWIENLLEDRPSLKRVDIERTRELMDLHAPGALVSGFESLIPAINLPDPDDCHVVAAAQKAEARYIVTFNLKDFPAASLEPLEIVAIHPDTFSKVLFDSEPETVLRSLKIVRARLRHPPKAAQDYLETLQNQGLTTLVQSVIEMKQQI